MPSSLLSLPARSLHAFLFSPSLAFSVRILACVCLFHPHFHRLCSALRFRCTAPRPRVRFKPDRFGVFPGYPPAHQPRVFRAQHPSSLCPPFALPHRPPSSHLFTPFTPLPQRHISCRLVTRPGALASSVHTTFARANDRTALDRSLGHPPAHAVATPRTASPSPSSFRQTCTSRTSEPNPHCFSPPPLSAIPHQRSILPPFSFFILFLCRPNVLCPPVFLLPCKPRDAALLEASLALLFALLPLLFLFFYEYGWVRGEGGREAPSAKKCTPPMASPVDRSPSRTLRLPLHSPPLAST